MTNSVSELTAKAVQLVSGINLDDGRVNDLSSLLAFLKKNKYPLVSLKNNGSWQAIWESPEFRSTWERENNLYCSLRAEYISIRNRLAQEGVDCVLIKAGGSAPSFPYNSDNLDILIKEEHYETTSTILKELGYLELKTLEEPKKYLFRKLRGGDYVATMHIHTEVAWLVGFLDEASLWTRVHTAPDDEMVTLFSPEDMILTNVAHSYYENKSLKLADIIKIRECWRKEKIDWKYLEKVAKERGWLDGLQLCLLVCAHLEKILWEKTSVPLSVIESWDASLKRTPLVYSYYKSLTKRSPVALPFKFSFFFSKYLYYRKILRDTNLNLVKRLRNVIHTLLIGVKLKANIRSQPSLLVSFSGADGSGKTWHAHTLMISMYYCMLKINYYWSRTGTSWPTRLISSVVKIFLRGKLNDKEGKLGVARRKERLRNPLIRLFWSYFVAAQTSWLYFLHVRIPLLRGKIVICDRYVFDAVAEMEYTLPPEDKFNRLAIKLMLALAPKPDVAYLLDIPDEVCLQRKTEDINADYLHQQRQVYANLAKRYQLRLKNTDREPSIIADEIASEILIPYFDNYKTFLNGLFLSNPDQLNRRSRQQR